MNTIDFLGYLAALCTTAAFLPQAAKSIRHGDTRSLSLGMYIVFTLGVGFWLVYGIFRKDPAIIAANSVTLLLSLAILSAKIRNDVLPGRRRKNVQHPPPTDR